MDLFANELGRFQFALVAMYHFLFVPLTLGLSFMLVIMESVYVLTNKQIWKDITKFWAKLFAINFALGVGTGVTMEFEFGLNWSYFSHFAGDVFGAPLAIEGLMAFFLESTFVGVMFFSWDRVSKPVHLLTTILTALGTNLSALWILVANGWMQHPFGAELNPQTMRMEMVNFYDVVMNPIAQAKFVHTASAGYTCASIFVMSISAYYLLRGKWVGFASRSMIVAAAFGLAGSTCVVVLGDESGYETGANQQMKMAAIESEWETQKPPAAITVIGFPDMENKRTDYALNIPYVLGIIGTRSFDTPLLGIHDLVAQNRQNIRSGAAAYDAVERLRADPKDAVALSVFKANSQNYGYALLLKRYVNDPRLATQAQIDQAAWDTVPYVPFIFWDFRVMMIIGFIQIAFFLLAFILCTLNLHTRKRWFLQLSLWSLPLPWIAIECGWMLAEIGRQPWVIDGVLPTFLASSSLTAGAIMVTIAGFVLVYTLLAIVEVMLMVKAVRQGPSLHKHAYHPSHSSGSARNAPAYS